LHIWGVTKGCHSPCTYILDSPFFTEVKRKMTASPGKLTTVFKNQHYTFSTVYVHNKNGSFSSP
jgi:hypothetical protein